jgi:ribosome-interacting GTPase 1
MVRRHGISRRNEIAAVEVSKAAKSIIHHHEHLLGVATRAQDNEVVVIGVASSAKRSLLAALEVATDVDELEVTSLDYVSIIFDIQSINLQSRE